MKIFISKIWFSILINLWNFTTPRHKLKRRPQVQITLKAPFLFLINDRSSYTMLDRLSRSVHTYTNINKRFSTKKCIQLKLTTQIENNPFIEEKTVLIWFCRLLEYKIKCLSAFMCVRNSPPCTLEFHIYTKSIHMFYFRTATVSSRATTRTRDR